MNPVPTSPTDFIAKLTAAAGQLRLIPHAAFQGAMAVGLDREKSFSLNHANELIDLAAEQYARWHFEFLYSPVKSPNRAALEESKAWLGSWKQFADAMHARLPANRKIDQELLWRRVMQHVLERCYADGQKNPVRRITMMSQSKVAQWLWALGLKGRVATWLESNAMFPRGTVGRVYQPRPEDLLEDRP